MTVTFDLKRFGTHSLSRRRNKRIALFYTSSYSHEPLAHYHSIWIYSSSRLIFLQATAYSRWGQLAKSFVLAKTLD